MIMLMMTVMVVVFKFSSSYIVAIIYIITGGGEVAHILPKDSDITTIFYVLKYDKGEAPGRGHV